MSDALRFLVVTEREEEYKDKVAVYLSWNYGDPSVVDEACSWNLSEVYVSALYIKSNCFHQRLTRGKMQWHCWIKSSVLHNVKHSISTFSVISVFFFFFVIQIAEQCAIASLATQNSLGCSIWPFLLHIMHKVSRDTNTLCFVNVTLSINLISLLRRFQFFFIKW